MNNRSKKFNEQRKLLMSHYWLNRDDWYFIYQMFLKYGMNGSEHQSLICHYFLRDILENLAINYKYYKHFFEEKQKYPKEFKNEFFSRLPQLKVDDCKYEIEEL